MRFYTAKVEEEICLLAGIKGCDRLYRLKDAGYCWENMNQLVRQLKPSQIKELESKLKEMSPVDEQHIQILAPILSPDQDILCLGINYWAHAEEAERYSNTAFGGKREKTIYFGKRASLISGPDAVIPSYPGLVEKLDYEVELAVILSDDVFGVEHDQVMNHVFGYSVFNDISVRNLQTAHKQWYFGKSLDGHSVMGPCIVSKDEIEDIYNLDIRSYVNGELRQNSNTGLMIQTIEGAVAELSQGMTLKGGTIIAMGTPAGVGMGFDPPRFLKSGDSVICEIDGIGSFSNVVK